MNDTKTVSGAIVHVTDADEAPLVRCLVNITPKQSGTGTPSPSNVRPISGWESVNLYKSGKNLLNPNIESKTVSGVTYSYSDGGILLNGTKAGSNVANLTSVVMDFPAGTYTFSGSLANGTIKKDNVNYNNITAYLIDEGGNATSIGQLFESKTITLSESIRAYLRLTTWSDNVIFTNALVHLQIELGSTATAYEPYTGTTTTVNLGRTVYGGTLDVVSGVLTVDKGFATFDGSSDETWFNNGSVGVYTPKASLPNVKANAGMLSNQYIRIGAGEAPRTNGRLCWNSNYTAVQFRNDNALNATDFRVALAQNPVTIVYELATPQTYTLTGREVSTLLGENNVWADAGDIEITYHTDTLGIYNKIYINGRPYFRPNDFEIKREDVYAGEYTTCTGKLIADKIGWKYSDLPMKWDILPDEDLVYLTTLTGAFDILFRDSDGQHTEQVIRRAFTNTPTRTTGPEGTKIWTGVEMEVSFLNTHPINE